MVGETTSAVVMPWSKSFATLSALYLESRPSVLASEDRALPVARRDVFFIRAPGWDTYLVPLESLVIIKSEQKNSGKYLLGDNYVRIEVA